MFPTDKPVAVVRLGGTLADADMNPNEGSIAMLAVLAETHYVVIVSHLAHTEGGTRIVYDWLSSNGVVYDEVWCGPGIPQADAWYDNEALTL